MIELPAASPLLRELASRGVRYTYRKGRLPRRYERAFIGWLKEEGTQLAAPRQQGGELSAPSNPPSARDIPRPEGPPAKIDL